MVGIRSLSLGFGLLVACSAWAGLGPVDPEDFLAIKPGDSYSEVSKRFGHDLRHSFTVRRQGHEWQLFKCYLKARRYDGFSRDLLFRDGMFEKFVDVTRAVQKDDGPLTWQPDDYAAVDQVLTSRFDLDQFKKDKDAYDGKNGGSLSLNALPLIVFTPLTLLEYPRRYRVARAHEEAQTRFDGSNFKIGDVVEMVRTRLGDPSTRHSFPGSGLEVWSYAYIGEKGCLTASQMCSRLVLVILAGTIESIYNTDLHGGSGWLVLASWL